MTRSELLSLYLEILQRIEDAPNEWAQDIAELEKTIFLMKHPEFINYEPSL